MAKPNVVSKEELVQSAQRCIVEKGFDKTTLKAVADNANVTQGTVFYHFKTKEQLFVEVVKHMCKASWKSMKEAAGTGPATTPAELLEAAKERCSYDSFYHQLFFSSLAAGLQNDSIREQLSQLIGQENAHLTELLSARWHQSPIPGISLDGWGILLNALIDGLAVQALLSKDFPADRIYTELEQLLLALQERNQTE
ncbi:hypothetical protein GCM10023310_51570 [Paenibacillus vulneris]|uniref:TetR/AcrR family transcriptional regulator n=1 Tax=Paenibacillus vulneris TaxID=1133364 RepID=A0ABW3UJT3_9BACL